MSLLLDLLLPVDCVGCARPGRLLCEGCGAALAAPPRLAWPTPPPPALPPPWAIAPYGGACRSVLIGYKERQALGLLAPLGDALARALVAAAAGIPSPLVVPVPSTRRSVRARGDDVTMRLARRAVAGARRRGLRCALLPAVRHCRGVADSAGLGAATRARNLRGAFETRPGAGAALRGSTVIVVDDLITTGTTIAEVAAAVRAAGGVVVAAATVAATVRERPGATVPGGISHPRVFRPQ
jgi:predicted amidophosphoribosyltransferase